MTPSIKPVEYNPTATQPLTKPVTQRMLNGREGEVEMTRESSFVYVVGNVNAKFPSLSLEKELYQNSLILGTKLPLLGQVNDDIGLEQLNRDNDLYKELFKGLSEPKNRYIAREMNWVLDNRFGEQLYDLYVSTEDLLTQCISALGRTQSAENEQVIVIGKSNHAEVIEVSAILPVAVMPLGQLVHGDSHSNNHLQKMVKEITSLDSSSGNTDALRALNFVLYNNPKIYEKSSHLYYKSNSDGPNPSGYQLISVDVDTLTSGDRIVANVIFTYQGINTGAFQYWYSRADITGEYPFLVTDWEQYLPTRMKYR
ncbi:hypothetical protein EYS14_19530 [Alteromonadaceae bacterium M269]|nr:hypothetical protein EYS14_19530 [Alteromonadaceae bacterium M269]